MDTQTIKEKLLPHIHGYNPEIEVEELEEGEGFITMTSYTNLSLDKSKRVALSTPIGGFFSMFPKLEELTHHDIEEIIYTYSSLFADCMKEHKEYKH